MAISKKKLADQENTGFGTNSSSTGGRFLNRDGRVNVVKRGIGVLNRYSWYHTMLGMPRARFLLLLLSIYIAINLVFAGIYYMIGVEHLAGIILDSPWTKFTEVFFFSTQTFTTVGYGRISPTGFATSAVATFEAFLGLLNFAIATGLFYGRFSRPKAFIRFSDKALISPYKNGYAFMFRVAPYKNNSLSEAEVKVTLAMTTEVDGKLVDKFFPLKVEIASINSLVLSWTIVHAINEDSPLAGFTEEDIRNTDLEVMVYLRAFDEVFSNNVIAKTSYISNEIIWGAKFRMMYHPSDDKNKTVLELDLLNAIDLVYVARPEQDALQSQK
jgi:inward rectifier potassium channel